jgi:hypothetical protein
MTITEIKTAIVATLMGLYPNSDKLGRGSEAGYHLALEDIPVEAFSRDIWRAIVARHPSYPPNPGELRSFVLEAVDATPDAELAWQEVQKQVKDVGNWGRPEFSDPAILRAVNGVGGWEAVCSCEIANLPTLRAQFRNQYNAAKKSDGLAVIREALPANVVNMLPRKVG